jgi:hypothetical protein
VPEDRHAVGCVLGVSLAENIYLNRLHEFTRFGFLNRAALEREASALMRRFDVRGRGPGSLFSSLSGGNQQKAVLAREITLPNLSCLVAAQPTPRPRCRRVAAVYSHYPRGLRSAASRSCWSRPELDELLTVADPYRRAVPGPDHGILSGRSGAQGGHRCHDGGGSRNDSVNQSRSLPAGPRFSLRPALAGAGARRSRLPPGQGCC